MELQSRNKLNYGLRKQGEIKMNHPSKIEGIIEEFRNLPEEEQEKVVHTLELCGGELNEKFADNQSLLT